MTHHLKVCLSHYAHSTWSWSCIVFDSWSRNSNPEPSWYYDVGIFLLILILLRKSKSAFDDSFTFEVDIILVENNIEVCIVIE